MIGSKKPCSIIATSKDRVFLNNQFFKPVFEPAHNPSPIMSNFECYRD